MILLRRMIGDALRARRQSQHRTLREVSTAANVSLGYLSEIERGQKEASSELLAAICDALGAQLSELLREVSHTVEVAEKVAVPAGRGPLVSLPSASLPSLVPAGRSAVGSRPSDDSSRPAVAAPSTPDLVPAGAFAASAADYVAAGADYVGAAADLAPTGLAGENPSVLKASENVRHPRLTVDSDVVVSVHQSGPFKATLRATRNVRNAKRGREVACVG